jgi:ATP-dependent protease ClpP protease subunit
MYNAIQQHPAEVTSFIESEAASAASFVAMAADTVTIYKNAKIFIHDAHGFGIGNAGDFRALADLLDEESNNIASIYADKAGGGTKKWRDAMQANDGIGSTYRGQEAVDAGLADELAAAPAKPARNAQPVRAVAQADPEPELDLSKIPPLADHAGYKKPAPDLAGLFEKHPLKVGG